MAVLAPLRVPVELRRGTRWFRLAHGVSEGGLLFARALPQDLDGVIEVAFHLPEDPLPIACLGRVIDVEDEVPTLPGEPEIEALGGGEAALRPGSRRAVRFVELDPETRARIAGYVEERVPQ